MKYVYFFGAGKADGDGDMKDLLGGKGAGLAEMTKIGLPVPAGFTITTETCDYYLKHDKKYPKELGAGGIEEYRATREAHRQKAGRCARPSFGQRPLRFGQVHARHDGDHSQPRIE